MLVTITLHMVRVAILYLVDNFVCLKLLSSISTAPIVPCIATGNATALEMIVYIAVDMTEDEI